MWKIKEMTDELVDRIAKAMYGTLAHTVEWEQCWDEHKELWRREARAAITELIAILNVRKVFPDSEQLSNVEKR